MDFLDERRGHIGLLQQQGLQIATVLSIDIAEDVMARRPPSEGWVCTL